MNSTSPRTEILVSSGIVILFCGRIVSFNGQAICDCDKRFRSRFGLGTERDTSPGLDVVLWGERNRRTALSEPLLALRVFRGSGIGRLGRAR